MYRRWALITVTLIHTTVGLDHRFIVSPDLHSFNYALYCQSQTNQWEIRKRLKVLLNTQSIKPRRVSFIYTTLSIKFIHMPWPLVRRKCEDIYVYNIFQNSTYCLCKGYSVYFQSDDTAKWTSTGWAGHWVSLTKINHCFWCTDYHWGNAFTIVTIV